eukprot:1609353-Rhodomonas_salina.1
MCPQLKCGVSCRKSQSHSEKSDDDKRSDISCTKTRVNKNKKQSKAKKRQGNGHLSRELEVLEMVWLDGRGGVRLVPGGCIAWDC